jgi:hypothetical protein
MPMSNLSTPARLEYYDELAKALPPPMPDTPELRHRRLSTAIEAFQDLQPGNAYEARLVVQIVLCGAHAVECMFEASIHQKDFAKRSRCRAQASSFQREERAASQILAREQKERRKTEAVTAPAQWRTAVAAAPPPHGEAQAAPRPVAETAAPQPVAETATPQPVAETAAPRPVQAETAAPRPLRAATAAPQPTPAPVTPLHPATPQAAPQTAAAGAAPPPSPEAIAQAEAFMMEDNVAAAQIRHDRGVTAQNTAYFHEVTFPADPAVIDALVRGTSPLLATLDEIGGEDLDEAA